MGSGVCLLFLDGRPASAAAVGAGVLWPAAGERGQINLSPSSYLLFFSTPPVPPTSKTRLSLSSIFTRLSHPIQRAEATSSNAVSESWASEFSSAVQQVGGCSVGGDEWILQLLACSFLRSGDVREAEGVIDR